MHCQFKYFSQNISDKLPADWVTLIKTVAKNHARKVLITPKSITSREKESNVSIETLVVDGVVIKEKLSWLYDLYVDLFRKIGQTYSKEQIFVAENPLYAINLNIQKGSTMRYECHVDSNPLQGLLYVTTHKTGQGGELIISNNEKALGAEAIEKDATIIYPKSGDLVFFDARKNPHFVRPLISKNGIRISVAMNFYTTSSPENYRPQDLNQHLFGAI